MGVVVVLLTLIAGAVLVPPALHWHAGRQDAFLASLGSTPVAEHPRATNPRSSRVHRRRRIAGGLLVAMATTLVVGLLPTFRALLIVHLFLVDAFIAYIALLAHAANQAARPASALAPTPTPRGGATAPRPWVSDLGPVVPLG